MHHMNISYILAFSCSTLGSEQVLGPIMIWTFMVEKLILDLQVSKYVVGPKDWP